MEILQDDKTPVKESKSKLSLSGKILISATGGAAVVLSVICASFVAPAFRRICLPYVPATTEQISNVLNFLPKNANGKLLDIGSGDGRIVIAAAKHGIRSDGVELNSWLVLYSRLAALRNGVKKQTHFFRKDLWKFDINPYNYIIIFGVEQMMKDLETKILTESQDNTQVIACRFPLPNLKAQRIVEDGVNTVWFYDLSTIKRESIMDNC